jgi:hypothetical protein
VSCIKGTSEGIPGGKVGSGVNFKTLNKPSNIFVIFSSPSIAFNVVIEEA